MAPFPLDLPSFMALPVKVTVNGHPVDAQVPAVCASKRLGSRCSGRGRVIFLNGSLQPHGAADALGLWEGRNKGRSSR
jgi:hypothetical protein